MQPGKLHHEPKTFSIPEIEGDHFVLGDAIEIAIGTKAKTARPAKFGQPFGTKDAYKTSVCSVIFTDRRHGIGRSKWILARYNDVPIGRDGSVQNFSHILSGYGFGLHDLRLIERLHVHVALGRPCRSRDVAQPCCGEVET